MNGQSGATFKVLDAKGETIQTGLTTNNQGKLLQHLAPGKYRFVETSANRLFIKYHASPI